MNLIIGKNGFIAKKLLQRGVYKLTSSSILDDISLYLDLSKPEQFDYSIINEKTNVIFLAAISSPDECNHNYEISYKINVVGTKYFINEALKQGANVLFFSSDVVYGNTTKKVNEESPTNPFGNYAKMKDYIEKNFEHTRKFKVFRLSYVISKEDKYLEYLQSCVYNQKVAEVYHPFSRKAIYIDDLLEAIESILRRWDEFDNQKFNICGEMCISRKDIADFYNECVGNKLTYLTLKPNQDFWDARPKDINISSIYLEKLLGRKPLKIKDVIFKIIKED